MANRRRVSIDTSSVIGQFLGRHEVHTPGPEYDLYVSVHVVGELFLGAYRSHNASRGCAEVEHFLTFCAVLPATAATARIYGALKADLANRGSMIPDNDIWIAATALEHNLPLATRDAHFSRIPTLPLLRW